MKAPAWWATTAKHWQTRTTVIVAILGILVAAVVTVVVSQGGEDERPPTGMISAASTSPTSGSGCSPSSEARLIGWGPDRPTYTDHSLPPALVINSTRTNPSHGDERNFVAIRELGDGEAVPDWADRLEARPGDRYVVRAYARIYGPSDEAAHDVRIRFSLPTCTGHQVAIHAFISSLSFYPAEVWDGASLWAREDFNVVLVPDSIKVWGNAFGKDGTHLGEEVFSSKGVFLGDQQDGVMRVGYQHALYVTFEVRAQFAQ